MGNHRFDLNKHQRRGDRPRDPRRFGHNAASNDDRERPERLRIPFAAMLGGLLLWSLLALGLWALVDPLLAWAANLVGPASDLGTGLAGWFGLGAEATALRDAANVEGLAGWASGLIHFLAKAAIVLVWSAGAIGLFALPAILRRRRALW
ncbi:hypothetical protein LGT41_0009815 [Abyssibius alkaniclasticus]|uniref:hypothetical protein n=1 Tax=Abyssibius alkaniclasticus TaxID=2881234 RepID=UPI0023649C61|nr:hypothetical protein [Abyssibius alkaniclasticus]UPH70110.1 hypothetical protein LGT41_0009815 [Abyssibius alkaniclasticus]|tara:strand:+ start:2104 stop:2553 length:450 start_codon:yes stop_codon:yes gene_type:complete